MRAAIFACSRDLERAELAAARLIRFGICPVLALDAGDSCDHSHLPLQVVRTRFPRNGNLNGGACLAGMLAVLAELQGDAPCVLKVDADTLLTDPHALLDPFDGEFPPAIVGASDPHGKLRGPAYALNARALLPVLAPMCATRTSTAYGEASTLGFLAKMAGFSVHLLPFGSLFDAPMPNAATSRAIFAAHCGFGRDVMATMRSLSNL